MDTAGETLWQWNYLEQNRYLERLGPVAIAPDCNTVAIGGSSSYKYIWTATRAGARSFLKTIGTPQQALFNLSGDTLAVTTAGPHAYLLSPTLEIQWSGRLSQFPITWPGAVRWNGRPEVEFPTRGEVEYLFGNVVMLWRSDAVSEDGQWRVMWTRSRSFRRSDEHYIEFRGPIPNAYRSRSFPNEGPPRWRKAMSCPSAELTPDGRYVIARGELTFDSDEHCGDNLSTYVFDRNGRTVLAWKFDPTREPEADQQAFADALFATTGFRREIRTNRPLSLPQLDDDPGEGVRAIQTWPSPDGEMELISRGGRWLHLSRGL